MALLFGQRRGDKRTQRRGTPAQPAAAVSAASFACCCCYSARDLFLRFVLFRLVCCCCVFLGWLRWLHATVAWLASTGRQPRLEPKPLPRQGATTAAEINLRLTLRCARATQRRASCVACKVFPLLFGGFWCRSLLVFFCCVVWFAVCLPCCEAATRRRSCTKATPTQHTKESSEEPTEQHTHTHRTNANNNTTQHTQKQRKQHTTLRDSRHWTAGSRQAAELHTTTKAISEQGRCWMDCAVRVMTCNCDKELCTWSKRCVRNRNSMYEIEGKWRSGQSRLLCGERQDVCAAQRLNDQTGAMRKERETK